MYRCSRWTGVLLAMTFFAVPPGALGAASRIGLATSVRPNVQGIVGTKSHALFPGSELYANETVRTGNLGQAELVFIDNTSVSVGPISEVLLDTVPTSPSGRFVMRVSHGAFRVVTGTQIQNATYQIKTSHGTLEMRHAVVEFTVEPQDAKSKKGKTTRWGDCDTVVRLVKGQATYRAISGQTAELKELDTVVCISPLGAMAYAASSDSLLTEVPPPPIVPDGSPSCVSPTTLNCR